MVLEGGRADLDVLALLEEAVLQIQNLAVPNLVGAINNPDVTGVVVKLEELYDLN